MSKRRTADATETASDQSIPSSENPTPPVADAGQPAAAAAQQSETQSTPPDTAADSHAAGEKRKTTWVKNFGSFTDNLAGVSLNEDRENHLMSISFVNKPSDAVRTLLKGEPYAFRYDPDSKVWYKRISQVTPAQSRREAQDLAFEVANIIRGEKGFEPHTPLGRAT